MTAVDSVEPGRPLATGEALGASNTCRVIELVFSVGVHDRVSSTGPTSAQESDESFKYNNWVLEYKLHRHNANNYH